VRAAGGELLDPLKVTVVQNQRSMTTWVVRKRGGSAGAWRCGIDGRVARRGGERAVQNQCATTWVVRKRGGSAGAEK